MFTRYNKIFFDKQELIIFFIGQLLANPNQSQAPEKLYNSAEAIVDYLNKDGGGCVDMAYKTCTGELYLYNPEGAEEIICDPQ